MLALRLGASLWPCSLRRALFISERIFSAHVSCGGLVLEEAFSAFPK